MKLYVAPPSPRAFKVIALANYLGLEYELKPVDLVKGDHMRPEFAALNPNKKMPVLEDDGFVLWESNAIVRYLAARHGAGRLEPDDLRVRARANQWMDWQLSVVAPALTPAFLGLIRTPPEKRDQAAIAASQKKTIDAMIIFDAALAGRPYVAGDAFSIGDMPMGIMAYRYPQLVPERPPLSNLERWYASIAERPAFIEHVSSILLQ
jgi:glutathione S-transferase